MDANLELTDKVGYILFKKGIIDTTVLEQALAMKANDTNKIKKNLAQILVQEFKYDHDVIFKEVANLYAFREVEATSEILTPQRLEFIKQSMLAAGETMKQLMLQVKVIPFMYDERQKDKLLLAAIDPTERNIPKIAFGLNAKKYEVMFIKLRDFDKLTEKLFPPENEFLKKLEDMPSDFALDDQPEQSDDEAEIEAEVNKSALINLIEAALVEGTRRGVSDIHCVPKDAKTTSILFRIDGNLQVWHTQENTSPEAVLAVVKDRSRGMDRFEREKA
ncbi:MAG: type II/IV secretion system protein, partial [Ignavibacteriaceae bacterium]